MIIKLILFYLKPYQEDTQVSQSSQEDPVNRKGNPENHTESAEGHMSRHGFPRKKKWREAINVPEVEGVSLKSVVTWHLADLSQEKPGFGSPLMVS